MKMKTKHLALIVLAFFAPMSLWAQEDTSAVEEDFSMYDNFGYADAGTKTFANAKISGLSPARFITVGYDYQAGYDMTAGAFNNVQEQTARVNSTQGLRLGANVPVISKNSLLVQLGAQFWIMDYSFKDEEQLSHPLLNTVNDNNLKTMGIFSTIYKPLNENTFLLVQLQADMNGDYAMSQLQPMRYNRYSAAVLWGKRPSDYKQWAIGLSRTYRAGELNYVPILMYNWTSATSNWGVEMLLPARGHVRYSFNSRSMLMAGFALEGNSYRIGNQGNAFAANEYEIRRSEIRARLMYQRQLAGFIWVAIEAGNRINYSYNVDDIPGGRDFLRLFDIVDDRPSLMENQIGNPFYFNLSFNFVSP